MVCCFRKLVDQFQGAESDLCGATVAHSQYDTQESGASFQEQMFRDA